MLFSNTLTIYQWADIAYFSARLGATAGSRATSGPTSRPPIARSSAPEFHDLPRDSDCWTASGDGYTIDSFFRGC